MRKSISRLSLILFAAMFLAAPRPASAYEFIVLGDSRPLFLGGPQTLVYQRIIEEANLIRPDLVINVGDIVYGYFGSANETQREYDDFMRVTSQLKMPWHVAVGNHDVAGENSVASFQKYIGPLYGSFNHGGDHFVLINTDQMGMDSAALGDEQLKWLDDDLTKNANASSTFIFMHRPIFYNGSTNSTSWKHIAEALRAEEIFIRHKVKYVFMGDAHIYSPFDRKGIHYVISGGGGAETGPPANQQFSHYLHVKSRNGKVTMKTIEPLHIWVNYLGPNDGTSDYLKMQVNVSQTDLYIMRLRGVTAYMRFLKPGEKYVTHGCRIIRSVPSMKGNTLTLYVQLGEFGYGFKEISVKIVKEQKK